MEQKYLDKLKELEDTNAFPLDDVNNLLPIDECTYCGKRLDPLYGNCVPDGIICDKCSKTYNEKYKAKK